MNILIEDFEKILQTDESPLKEAFYLEVVQIFLQLYSEISRVQTWLDQALEKLQLQASLVGKYSS